MFLSDKCEKSLNWNPFSNWLVCFGESSRHSVAPVLHIHTKDASLLTVSTRNQEILKPKIQKSSQADSDIYLIFLKGAKLCLVTVELPR